MPWIIDTDPGVDDAAAVMAGLGHLDVIGLSIVHGNVEMKQALANALYIKHILGSEVFVYPGAEAPLLEPRREAVSVHGTDGLGDIERPEIKLKPESEHAVDMIISAGEKHPGNLSLLTLGPLTNVALALAKDKKLASRIKEIVIMGGTCSGRGNATMVGEFNFAADPEAAAMVLGAGIPVTLVPWEPTVEIRYTPEELEKGLPDNFAAREFIRMCGHFSEYIGRKMGKRAVVLCDLIAAAVAIDQRVILKSERLFGTVETAGEFSRGLTALDFARVSGREANLEVVLQADKEKALKIFREGIINAS